MKWRKCSTTIAKLCNGILGNVKWIPVLFTIMVSVPVHSADRAKDSLVFYGGSYTDTSLLSILSSADVDYKPSRIMVAGWNRKLDGQIDDLSFESEVQLGIHSGIMKHMEANGALLARWNRPLGLPVSLAFGEGLSFASREPDLEKYGPDLMAYRFNSQETNNLLNYLLVEMELYGHSGSSPWPIRPFMRIHHRSGIYGTYCPPVCGSNFITYGMKVDL